MKENKKGLQDLYTDEKIKGFWTWTWGDGWVDPYFNNELWIKLNEYMVREFALHPKKSEEDIFYDYALNHLKLSESDAEKFRKLCLLSTDAVYYGQATQYGWTNPWYVRDHYLAGIDLQDIVKNDFTEKVLAEKEHYIKDWYEIEKLSKQINLPNVVDDEFLKVSASYGRIKYEIIEQVWRIQILLAKHKLNKGFDVTEARGAIKLYNGKWQEWVALKKSSPLCPTLYVDYEVVHIPCFQPFKASLNELKNIVDTVNNI
ncbi:hypothetical protein [Joostella atrarenae]|uniref:hypothetical protein n=1 Tax=Joostella atrarenae TaxID=679257 RepID=UPI001F15A88C|nr:hypothetical protein [Joostella atrarenae]